MGLAAYFIFICVAVPFSDAVRNSGPCSAPRSYVILSSRTCTEDQFKCNNGRCVPRSYYCDGGNDCGDASDEPSCRIYPNCSQAKSHCKSSRICIPMTWICDGYRDCDGGEDETNCGIETGTDYLSAHARAMKYLSETKKAASTIGLFNTNARKSAVLTHLTSPNFSSPVIQERQRLAHESSIQLLALLNRKKLQDLPASEIASFVNAFLVTCIDPRSFFSMDLISELRSRIKAPGYTVPYVYLTLCNAGELIAKEDVEILTAAFWDDEHQGFWTSTRAMILMALACAKQQAGSVVNEALIKEMAREIKAKQYRNGTVEDIRTTALVMQALYASESEADPDNFDEEKAISQLLRAQLPDGSFGSLTDTYYVLPVLNCSSLVNISNSHCPPTIRTVDPTGQSLNNAAGPKIRVKYSLWIGENRHVEKTLSLLVPTNSSFYKVMEIAADIDNTHRFEYVLKRNKPYITAISGIRNDPEGEYFWLPYILADNVTNPIGSPADVVPKEHDHLVMWYKQAK